MSTYHNGCEGWTSSFPHSCSYVFKMAIQLHIRSGCQWLALGFSLLLFKTCPSVNLLHWLIYPNQWNQPEIHSSHALPFVFCCFFFCAKKSRIQVNVEVILSFLLKINTNNVSKTSLQADYNYAVSFRRPNNYAVSFRRPNVFRQCSERIIFFTLHTTYLI